MNENLTRICYDADPACRVHHTVGYADNYAMMDTSDGLADALFQITKASGVKIVTKSIEGIFGAEDYNLVAVVPEDFLDKISDFYIIGKVVEFDGYYLEIDGKSYKNYDELDLFNHFSS